jgi:hypothetical protein
MVCTLIIDRVLRARIDSARFLACVARIQCRYYARGCTPGLQTGSPYGTEMQQVFYDHSYSVCRCHNSLNPLQINDIRTR